MEDHLAVAAVPRRTSREIRQELEDRIAQMESDRTFLRASLQAAQIREHALYILWRDAVFAAEQGKEQRWQEEAK